MKELELGEFKIPADCTAKITNGGTLLVVYNRVRKSLGATEYRCLHCKHFVEGKTIIYRPETTVCEMKPKRNREGCFYYRNMYNKICDKFELRDEREFYI